MKPKRIVDKKLLSEIKAKPCVVCGKQGPNDAHHIKTRKSFGDDVKENLICLCRFHHQLWHQKGVSYMAVFYSDILRWLLANGWTKELGRWRRWR